MAIVTGKKSTDTFVGVYHKRYPLAKPSYQKFLRHTELRNITIKSFRFLVDMFIKACWNSLNHLLGEVVNQTFTRDFLRKSFRASLCHVKSKTGSDTVDGRNPAPPGMVKTYK